MVPVVNPLEGVAKLLGLTYVPGALEKMGVTVAAGLPASWSSVVTGTVDGVPVRVTASGEQNRVSFYYGASFPRRGVDLDIRRRTVVDALLWGRGRSPVTVGTPLDGRIVVRTTRPETVVALLTHSTSEAILSLADRLPSFVIRDGNIEGVDRRSRMRMPEPTEVAAVVRRCVRVATELNPERSTAA